MISIAKERIITIIIWFSLSLSFLTVATFIFWLIFPYKILTFGSENGTFVSKTVRSGEYLEMYQDSCKYINIPSHINRQFIDGIVYQVYPSINNRPMGCSKNIEYIKVPEPLPPGKYFVRTVISFEVNPLRTVSYTVKSEDFIIVK